MSAPVRTEAPSTRVHIQAVAIATAEHDVTRPNPGYSWVRDVEPLAGLAAARAVRADASAEINHYASKARGEGASWAQVAETLGMIDTLLGGPDVEGVYELVASGDRWDRWAYWRCSTCEQRVRDKGPWGGHPDDNESGHAEDCSRHTAAVEAYLVEIGWDD